MMQMCNYRATLGLLALVYPSGKDFKTQGKYRCVYIEYLLMFCHMLSPVLDTGRGFERCYVRDRVEETIFTCINCWRTLNLSC